MHKKSMGCVSFRCLLKTQVLLGQDLADDDDSDDGRNTSKGGLKEPRSGCLSYSSFTLGQRVSLIGMYLHCTLLRLMSMSLWSHSSLLHYIYLLTKLLACLKCRNRMVAEASIRWVMDLCNVGADNQCAVLTLSEEIFISQ